MEGTVSTDMNELTLIKLYNSPTFEPQIRMDDSGTVVKDEPGNVKRLRIKQEAQGRYGLRPHTISPF